MKKKTLALLLALLCLSGCGGSARNLTDTVKTTSVDAAQDVEEADAAALAEFSLALLKENWKGENILVSPLSVLSALGMTVNGAKGETLEQMESVLGLPAENLNALLSAWAENLPREKNCRVNLANSLWLRDSGNFQADPEFLSTVKAWYGADIFASPFDGAALREINGWVDKNTHGMIPEILDRIPDTAVMYLINALALEAEWEQIYRKDQVWDQIFTAGDGTEQPVELMYSGEGLYLRNESAQGFLKPYKGGCWAFAALLPEEGVKLEDYLSSLTGERLYEILSNAEETPVQAAIPKFQCRYGVNLAESLEAMGMTNAFDPGKADFSGMGSSSLGPLFVSGVIHKTFISVDEKGTKAGAATAVQVDAGADAPGAVPVVYLNRPFLYMLVDRETNLPAFIGLAASME